MTPNERALREALEAAAKRVHSLGHTWRADKTFEDCTYEECKRTRALLEVTK